MPTGLHLSEYHHLPLQLRRRQSTNLQPLALFATMSNFPYTASKAAAILFAVLFEITLGWHSFQAFRTRSLFMLVLMISAGLEVSGYGMRIMAIMSDPLQWPFALSQICIIVAPAFLAAQLYLIFGRMISFVGPDSFFLSHQKITKLFLMISGACVGIQAIGMGIFITNPAIPDAVKSMFGKYGLIGGLFNQVGALVFFLGVTIFFDRRCQRLLGDRIKELRPLLTVLYISAVLNLVRTLYRAIEISMPTSGYLSNNEWLFYAFDAAPMFLVTILFNVFNPTNYLPKEKGLRMDGSFEEAPPPARRWWSKAAKTSKASSGHSSEDNMTMNRV